MKTFCNGSAQCESWAFALFAIYPIKIKGHLDEQWADWFEGMTFTHESDGTTTLYGPVIDQAALHGILNGIRDLGLALISVQPVNPDSKKDQES